MHLMIVPGVLVCSSFLISVCMFNVSKALLISSDTVIVRAGCVWYVFCYVRKKALLQCLQLQRGGIWVCMRRPSSMSLLGFGIGTMLANFHMCGIMLVLREVFNMRVQEGLCVLGVRCLVCQGIVSCYFHCLLDLSCGECDVISLYCMCCSVNVSVVLCVVCCVFDIVCELFGETIRNLIGYGCYFVVKCYGSV